MRPKNFNGNIGDVHGPIEDHFDSHAYGYINGYLYF